MAFAGCCCWEISVRAKIKGIMPIFVSGIGLCAALPNKLQHAVKYTVSSQHRIRMEKRYQVFISSTFVDLKDERQAALKAILEIDHMPAGMELFPATDDSAWQLIRDVIDSSDYYILIIGGRYGSLDETGLGYTEKEYDYALTTKKPVIPLLHENPDNLPRDKTETDSAAWEKLKKFPRVIIQLMTLITYTEWTKLTSWKGKKT